MLELFRDLKMNFIKLEKILKKEPNYRLSQINNAIFRRLITDWNQASNLSLNLRQELKKNCPLEIKAETFISQDKRTIKAQIILEDKQKIEAVLMCHDGNRNTVCVSCQVGCSLECKFCLTGKMGFKRNLTASEIVSQVLFFARYLKSEKENVTNIVFMGMGEPFLNYENVLRAIKILNDPRKFNIGARKISISTAGIVEGIKKLGLEGLQVNLAISLHAPDNKLRSKLMPINKKYSLEKIFQAVDEYIKKTSRRVMFEYLLLKDVNDANEQALELAGLLKNRLCFVNLIIYNPTMTKFKAADDKQIKKFKKILEEKGIAVTQRYRFGRDIEAACGQLGRNM